MLNCPLKLLNVKNYTIYEQRVQNFPTWQKMFNKFLLKINNVQLIVKTSPHPNVLNNNTIR